MVVVGRLAEASGGASRTATNGPILGRGRRTGKFTWRGRLSRSSLPWPGTAWKGRIRLDAKPRERSAMKSGPEVCHEIGLDRAPRALGYRPDCDLAVWRGQVKTTLATLLGSSPDRVPLDVQVEWEAQREGY